MVGAPFESSCLGSICTAEFNQSIYCSFEAINEWSVFFVTLFLGDFVDLKFHYLYSGSPLIFPQLLIFK